jgi:transposase
MGTAWLFTDLPATEQREAVPAATPAEAARVVEPVRNQVEMVWRDLDSLVAEDHPARAIWGLLEQLDLREFYAQVRAVQGRAGRPASDPRVLLALWVYATVEGLGSARRLAELSERDDVYRWLRGGVPLNYHLVADFRTAHQAALNELLTEIITTLLAEELVSLKRVAQDGMRVRASAGAASFRRERTLERLRQEAHEQVERLAAEVAAPGGQASKRERAARARVAQERGQRVERALAPLPAVRALKEPTAEEQAKARVSTTDPDARVMKMADGGFRPAYNVELATDTGSHVVVGVTVTNAGTDAEEARPMAAQVEARSGRRPEEYLVDGGFAPKQTVPALEAQAITVYAPVQKPKDPARNPYEPLKGDAPAVAAWRQRMGTPEAKAIYKERAATAECVNAQCRSRYGLQQFAVRGVNKVACVVLLTVITHNLLRWLALTA